MKINNFDLNIEWFSSRILPDSVEIESDFPSYNITIKDEKGNLIEQINNINDFEKIVQVSSRKASLKTPKIKYRVDFAKNKVKNTFKYNFERNFNKYREINNKIGFYKKFQFDINYNNTIPLNKLVDLEYMNIEDLDKNLLFNKVYRSSDYLSIKLIINKLYFDSKEIKSFLILSTVSNKFTKEKELKNLFVENIKENWLDVNTETASLSIPFIESEIVELSENINIKIIPLTFCQAEIYKFLKNSVSEEDINALYEEYYPNQCLNIGKIYRQISNASTAAFYQNYIYLFNKDSIETNSLQTDLNINDMIFNKYFPLLNKDQFNKTICLSDDLNTDDVLDNAYNLEKDYLGYYAKDLTNYEDIAIDIDYLQNQGIRSAKILEIEELPDTCNIYIEFITSFYDNEKFYIETSNNLKFYEKYKTIIEDKEYITLLFKYSYSLQALNEYLSTNSSIIKSQIISDKDLINFSAKLIL
jgi:hypothetical protein